MATRLTFHGGAGTVTGSCYQIEHARGRFLVDCGMFQGTKTVRELNYGTFPFDPRVKLAREVLDDIRTRYGLEVLDPPVPKTIRFAEAPGRGVLQADHLERECLDGHSSFVAALLIRDGRR